MRPQGKKCKHKHQRRPRENSHTGKDAWRGESKRPSGQHSHTPGGNRSGPGGPGNGGGSNAAMVLKCSKCDGPHRFDQCTFKGTCLRCGKVGPAAVACRSKKSGDAPKSVSKARMAVSMQVRDASHKSFSFLFCSWFFFIHNGFRNGVALGVSRLPTWWGALCRVPMEHCRPSDTQSSHIHQKSTTGYPLLEK